MVLVGAIGGAGEVIAVRGVGESARSTSVRASRWSMWG